MVKAVRDFFHQNVFFCQNFRGESDQTCKKAMIIVDLLLYIGLLYRF